MRLKRFFLAACVSAGCLFAQPPALGAHSIEGRTPVLQTAAGPHDSDEVASPAWWKEAKKRFHTLALCGLASANVTYTLLVGFSGFGAAIGFATALLGVAMCL